MPCSSDYILGYTTFHVAYSTEITRRATLPDYRPRLYTTAMTIFQDHATFPGHVPCRYYLSGYVPAHTTYFDRVSRVIPLI